MVFEISVTLSLPVVVKGAVSSSAVGISGNLSR